ncbi:MAG: hypothetical protein HPY58_11090 [Firmicutes bacterium]|nr:hypothetical protein [Bacillota bacterium]
MQEDQQQVEAFQITSRLLRGIFSILSGILLILEVLLSLSLPPKNPAARRVDAKSL